MPIGKDARQKGYKHWYSAAQPDPNYPSGQDRRLITTEDQLNNLIAAAHAFQPELISIDTETTGLNTEKENLVGISIAISKTQAFYMPVGHHVGKNVPLDLALRVVAAFCKYAKRALFYNYRFDYRVLKKAGLGKFMDIDQMPYFDLSVVTFNADTNVRMPNLKWSALHFLGWKMKTFEEVMEGPEGEKGSQDGEGGSEGDGEAGDSVGSEREEVTNFAYNDPNDCFAYACDDVLAPYNLIFVLYHVYEEMKFVCDIDNQVLVPLMVMEDDPVKIDRDLVKKLDSEVTDKLANLSMEIFAHFGYSFGLGSTKQLLIALQRLGIQPKKMTKSGKSISTDEEALEELIGQHPVIPLLVRYKKLKKFETTYCKPFLNEWREDLGGGVRFAYKHNAVPTGRFASGSDAKNKYFCKINGQAIPKPHPAYYKAIEEPVSVDSPDIFSFLNYRFEKVDGKDGIEGFSLDENIRAAYKPNYPYHLWVSIDYAAQELRIPANLANEPVWIDAFTNNKDVHKSTALMCICNNDESLYDKEKRKAAKALNFGALYQGGSKTFSRQLGISEIEAQVLLDRWWEGLIGIRSWCDGVMNFGRRNGYISTYFGRKRRLRHWYSLGSRRMSGYADRTCTNHPVQGCAADMMRISLINIYNKCRNWIGRDDGIYLKSSIHDEINFSIDARNPAKFTEMVLMLQNIMEIKITEWKVPMLAEISIGRTWGTLFPFVYKNNMWVPKG
jgi:DNA polymerase-1